MRTRKIVMIAVLLTTVLAMRLAAQAESDFNVELIDDGDRYTGSLISGILSFTVNHGKTDEVHVEFHRVR